MRAAIFNGPDSGISIETLPDPEPAADELVLEVAFCGICGSDISMTEPGPAAFRPGRCFGHEYSGTVVDVGRDVAGWRVGDRAACIPLIGCGTCDTCRDGRAVLCSKIRGSRAGFAEFVSVPFDAAIHLPQGLSLTDGALVEPMACGLRALRLAGMQGGERILVLGAGAMALSVIWWARRLGAASIVVASRSTSGHDICLEFGADAAHSFDRDDPAHLAELLGGAPDIVAECVGKPGMLNLALDHVRPGGTVTSMGMCMTTEAILPFRLSFKEPRIVFPIAYSNAEFEETARAFDATGFSPEIMVSQVLPLERLDDTIERIRAGAKLQKVHIDPRLPAAAEPRT